MPALLRDFLYLDARLTSQYLAQLEGGVYDEEDRSEISERNRGGQAGAQAGLVSLGHSRGQSAEESASRTMRQTPEGNFRRLEKLLDEQDSVQWLEAFDEAIWDALERGEALRIESVLKVSSLYQATDMAASIVPMMELMEVFGESVDADTQEAITGLTQVNQVLKDISVVAHAAGTPKYKFICPLKRDFLCEEIGSLGGECIVVGILQRRLKAGERYSLLDAMGVSGVMSRADRRKAERDMKKDMPDTVVSAPAALLTPLAIYR